MSIPRTRSVPNAVLIAVPTASWGLLIGIVLVLNLVDKPIHPGLFNVVLTLLAVLSLVAFRIWSDQRKARDRDQQFADVESGLGEALRLVLTAIDEHEAKRARAVVMACCAPTVALPYVARATAAVPPAAIAAAELPPDNVVAFEM